ncbi:hypothetical protein OH687_25560 [Burkholderia anthina]|nr:hypothetical protein OH687_25560 [Burkholderia anthina]
MNAVVRLRDGPLVLHGIGPTAKSKYADSRLKAIVSTATVGSV